MRFKDQTWLRTGVLALAVTGLGLGLSSCTEDEDDEGTSYAPEHVTGTTNNLGQAALDLENYNVAVTVLSEGDAPVTGADVDVFQGESYALLWVELAGYYPIFQVLQLGEQELYTVNLTLIESGGFFQIFNADPPHIAHLFTDGSVTPHCFEGTLSDMYNAAATTLGGYWAIRVSGEAAALGDPGIVNLGLFTNGLSVEYFEQLMFSAASLYEGDTFQFCFYTIHVGDQDFYLPYVHVADVVAQQETEYDYKFILTWGVAPRDLDSHLYTPEIEGTTHHVYFANSGSTSTPPYAWLDVDDTSSYGPEATTIEELYPGTYTFSVYDWSGDGLLSTSGAHVEVFSGRDRVGGYDVPTTGGDAPHWWWTVGTVDGATGAFTLVNTLAPNSPAGVGHQEPMPSK
jgi:hypothetical protein